MLRPDIAVSGRWTCSSRFKLPYGKRGGYMDITLVGHGWTPLEAQQQLDDYLADWKAKECQVK